VSILIASIVIKETCKPLDPQFPSHPVVLFTSKTDSASHTNGRDMPISGDELAAYMLACTAAAVHLYPWNTGISKIC
jgi:hypothetical protein